MFYNDSFAIFFIFTCSKLVDNHMTPFNQYAAADDLIYMRFMFSLTVSMCTLYYCLYNEIQTD